MFPSINVIYRSIRSWGTKINRWWQHFSSQAALNHHKRFEEGYILLIAPHQWDVFGFEAMCCVFISSFICWICLNCTLCRILFLLICQLFHLSRRWSLFFCNISTFFLNFRAFWLECFNAHSENAHENRWMLRHLMRCVIIAFLIGFHWVFQPRFSTF